MSAFDQNMKLIFIRENKDLLYTNGCNLLRLAICSEPLASITLGSLNGNLKKRLGTCGNPYPRSNNNIIAIPQDWATKTGASFAEEPFWQKANVMYYKETLPIPSGLTSRLKANPWFIVANGRFVTQTDHQQLYKILAKLQADVVAVNVVPQLQPSYEKVLSTSQSRLVGFRRFYNNSAQPAPMPNDWPHYIFIRADILGKLLVNEALPLAFPKFINSCFPKSLTVRSLHIGGTVLDLDTEHGLLGLVATRLDSSTWSHPNRNNKSQKQILAKDSITISDSARLFGKVLFGKNVNIGQNTIIVGPTIIGNDVEIAQGATIRASIIGPGVSASRNCFIQNRVIIGSVPKRKVMCLGASTNAKISYKNSCANNFRTWPKFSYARCVKRIADIIASLVVLILFAPVLLVIALAIRLSSPGPVFFKDKRQGLQGRPFNCLKFRSMLVGADKMQDKLRALNQADGPQFKMANDPRLSTVGSFLRDTYIDEIPQFFNVLLGQMSIIGPRPSPESENTLCPSWRDARLSVRPGITGLWQICRTRRHGRDFQEWIYYDTKYIRNLSLRLDLSICWQTAKKIFLNFVEQF